MHQQFQAGKSYQPLSGHHNRVSEKNINCIKKQKKRKKKGRPKGIKIQSSPFFLLLLPPFSIYLVFQKSTLQAFCSYSPFSQSSSDAFFAFISLSFKFLGLYLPSNSIQGQNQIYTCYHSVPDIYLSNLSHFKSILHYDLTSTSAIINMCIPQLMTSIPPEQYSFYLCI